MGKIDLHVHSAYSADGELSPGAIIDLCIDEGVDLISITDHNSVKAIPGASDAAHKNGIQFIAASEINCQTRHGTVLHMLGYGIDPKDPFFIAIEDQVNEREAVANRTRIDVLRNLGIKMDDERIAEAVGDRILTCEILAEVAMNDSENRNHPLLLPFYPGGARSDQPQVNFFWDLCTTGKAADVPVEYLPVREVVEEIHRSGGIAVLAHPGASIGQDKELLDEIVQTGIDGLEVYSSYHDAEMTAYYEEHCARLNLGRTVGSDFHGKMKPRIQLGSVSANGNQADIRNFMSKAILP